MSDYDFIVYRALASTAGRYLRRPAAANWIRRGAALSFAGLGAKLALAEN